MHSDSITGVVSEAKRASESPVAQFLARAGLTARGVIYILIGWVAVLVALGQSSQEADQRGALELLAGKPYGLVSLWLLGVGFAAYALWRLSEAAFGVTAEPPGAGPRLKSLGRAVLYAGFAYLTFDVISGTRHSQSRQQQDMTATAMRNTEGRWLVGIVGLAVVIIGLVLVSKGVRRKFMKYLRDRKSTRLNSSHSQISYAVFCLKKKKIKQCTHNAQTKPQQLIDRQVGGHVCVPQV